MTTESMQVPAIRGAGDLLKAGAAAMLTVLGLGLVASLLSGEAAAKGALAGGVVAVAVYLSGSLVVNAVAGLMPGLSLLFAVSTYTLQVLVLGLFFSVLNGSDLLGSTLGRGWLGGAIIVVTVVWLGVQVVLASRARIPIYELPPRAGER